MNLVSKYILKSYGGAKCINFTYQTTSNPRVLYNILVKYNDQKMHNSHYTTMHCFKRKVPKI